MILALETNLVENSDWQSGLTPVRFSSIAFGDLDNNNFTDLILTGCLSSGALQCDMGVIAKVYLNNGTDLIESVQWGENLIGVGHSSLALGDIDNDGNLDLILSGCDYATTVSPCEGNRYSKIYINNGSSLVENEQWEQNLVSSAIGSIALGDIDNDGRLDLAQTGSMIESPYRIAKIYINNGTSFEENSEWETELTPVRSSSVSLIDIDNDGDLDLDLAGYDGALWTAKFYLNNGTSFVESTDWEANFNSWGWPENTFGDIDNDGRLDVIRVGTAAGDHLWVYRNTGATLVEYQKNAGD